MDTLALLDPQQWAAQQWSAVQLGDPRRTRRAVRLGTALAQQPHSGLPAQSGGWADLKAAYRLLNHSKVTHGTLYAPHAQHTLQQAQHHQVVLFIQDTSELDYSSHIATTGLGHIGDTRGRGIMLHTCLAVQPKQPSLLGLAYQKPWVRTSVHKGTETRTQRRARASEADLWAQTLHVLGRPPVGCTWVSVSDRASDVFAFLRQAEELGWQYLMRVCQDGRIYTAAGQEESLFAWVRAQSSQGSTKLQLRGRDGRPAREVTLQISWTPVQLRPPRFGPERKAPVLTSWCVRAWEAEGGEEALEWLLLTSVAVENHAQALERLEWYSQRWLIEEYHKCLKTGCRMEQRQLRSLEGLLGLLGFLAVVAVRLVQLRDLSREQPHLLAEQVCPSEWVEIVARQCAQTVSTLSVQQFWRGVARLGGFLGRKGDGEPGWQSLWSGWQRLMDISWGLSLARDGPTCGQRQELKLGALRSL